MKVDAWGSITMEIKAVGIHERTISEVKIKWQNIQESAKRSFAETQRHVRQTGGVPSPKNSIWLANKLST